MNQEEIKAVRIEFAKELLKALVEKFGVNYKTAQIMDFIRNFPMESELK